MRRAIAAIVVATARVAGADDSAYIDPSLWESGRLVGGQRDLQLEGQLAFGFRHRDGVYEGRVGAWGETGVVTAAGIDAEVDRTVTCNPDFLLGGRTAVGLGADVSWYALGARVRYHDGWLGLDLVRVNDGTLGQTQLDFGLGFDLHPTKRQTAIGAGVFAGIAVVALAVVLVAVANNQ